jgi:hypothetical protein
MFEPKIVKDLLSKEKFEEFRSSIISLGKQADTNLGWSRYELRPTELSTELHTDLTPIARQLFNAPAALKTFNCGAWSSGVSHMEPHYDVNACTYSLNMSIHVETEPWPIYIDGVTYTLEPGDAVISSGENHLHARDFMPDPENNQIINWFFFWVEPEHWWFTTEDNAERIRLKNLKHPDMKQKVENYMVKNKIVSVKDLYL